MTLSVPSRRRLSRRLAAIVLTAASIGLTAAVPAAAAGGDDYLRPDAPVAARVQDLLRRLTVEEKVGQLEQIAVTRVQGNDCTWSGGPLNETCLRQVLVDDAAGSILSGGGM